MLILASITALIATPVFSQVIDSHRVRSDADVLAQNIRFVRYRGIAEAKAYSVRFYPAASKYLVDTGTSKKMVYLSPGVTMGRITFATVNGEYTCRFLPDGTPSIAGSVELKGERGTRRYVIVNPVAGRIRVSEDPPR